MFSYLLLGIGMTREFQRRIFTPFSQQDDSIKSRYGGTGLGLSICKALTDSLQGTLTFSSQEKQGTSFAFCVPLKCTLSKNRIVEPKVGKSVQVPASVVKLHRALVVDDNPINVKVMCRMISSSASNVTCDGVHSGKEALTKIEENHEYDVIFLDWQMPEMDGIECAKKIRAMQQQHACPRLILVTAAEIDNISEDDDKVFDLILQKPLRMDMIKKMMSNLVQ